MARLHEMGKLSQNRLGRLAAMDPATIQGVIRRLHERGFIERLADPTDRRSEEHTSELQSLMRISYAVFCLKKNTHTPIHQQRNVQSLTSHTNDDRLVEHQSTTHTSRDTQL